MGARGTNQDYIDKAVEIFGITEDPHECGYILPDGEMLDFSGGLPSQKGLDHQEIKQIGVRMSSDFVDMGVIRFGMSISGEWILIQMSKPITASQKSTISRIIRDYSPHIYMDVRTGEEEYIEETGETIREVESFSYHIGTRPYTVFNQIDSSLRVRA